MGAFDMSGRRNTRGTPRPITPTKKVIRYAAATLIPLAIIYGASQRIYLGLGTWAEEFDLFVCGFLFGTMLWTMNIQDCETHTIRAIRIGSAYVGFCSSGPVIFPGFYLAKHLFEEERATELLQHLSRQGCV
jgi:hypothetical protein